MQAILKVDKGEQPYKIIRSPWLIDEEGSIMFKLLSKKRCDGQIEVVYLTERRTHKRVMARSIVPEERFTDAASVFRQVVWRFFPNTDLEVEEVEPMNIDSPKSNSQYNVAKNTIKGALWLRIKRRLRI